jgi:hypothetical protein
MDARSEELFGDMLDAINYKLNLEIEVGKKGITLYSKRGNNVHNGTRQHNA